jgi:hypothetical protein
VTASSARAWFRGQRPLRQADERVYYTQTPDSEADWFPFVPGPWRFERAEDYEATRERWEREILRSSSFPLRRHPEDPSAEDIPVRRPATEEQSKGEDHG